eukprot:scaffold676023_cov59-Prasinocladus_malaysianus.AAC.1
MDPYHCAYDYWYEEWPRMAKKSTSTSIRPAAFRLARLSSNNSADAPPSGTRSTNSTKRPRSLSYLHLPG